MPSCARDSVARAQTGVACAHTRAGVEDCARMQRLCAVALLRTAVFSNVDEAHETFRVARRRSASRKARSTRKRDWSWVAS
eukprot:3423319-Pleurochrysis_carterae.AAC.3